MKILILIFSIIYYSNSAFATDRHDICETQSKLARAIMAKRQANESIVELMDFMIYHRELIITAYETPLLSDENEKRRVIREFSNDAYLECIKGNL